MIKLTEINNRRCNTKNPKIPPPKAVNEAESARISASSFGPHPGTQSLSQPTIIEAYSLPYAVSGVRLAQDSTGGQSLLLGFDLSVGGCIKAELS